MFFSLFQCSQTTFTPTVLIPPCFASSGPYSSSKLLWMIGYFLLVVFNIGIGFSSSAVVFDVLRALAGVGTALVVPNSIALLSKQYEPGIQRTIAFSSFGALAPIGFQIHAVFASLVAERIGPRWIFWIESVITSGLHRSDCLLVSEERD